MNIHSVYNIFLPHFRRGRRRLFYGLMQPQEHERILDVGGDHWFWASMGCRSAVTCLNPRVPDEPYDLKRFSYVRGDGRRIPYPDNEFDIVFSNSTIEHVGTFQDQIQFASEIRRTGRRYWVQTPNRWFFIEPHMITPFIHFLPVNWQGKLLRYVTIWGLVAKPSKEQINDFLNSTRLLTRSEMVQLFPDGTLLVERFLGFAKSFVIYKPFSDKAAC